MSTVTVNKTIDFEKLIPDLKRFALKTNTRPVLQYAYYDGEYITVTDSHRLLRLNAAYVENLPSQDPFLYDLKNKEVVTSELNYPDTNRLIPHYSNTDMVINNSQLNEIRKSLNELLRHVKEKDNRVISIDITGHTLTLSDRGEISYKHDINKTGNDIKLHVNCKYMIDALMSANKLSKLSHDDLMINFVSSVRPLTIKQGNIFDIIVLPVRII